MTKELVILPTSFEDSFQLYTELNLFIHEKGSSYNLDAQLGGGEGGGDPSPVLKINMFL